MPAFLFKPIPRLFGLIFSFTLALSARADGPMTLECLQRNFWVRVHVLEKFPLVPSEFDEIAAATQWLNETVALAKAGKLKQGDARVTLYNEYATWARAQNENTPPKELVDLLWSKTRSTPAALALRQGVDRAATGLGVSNKSLQNALNSSVSFLNGDRSMAGNGVHVGPSLFLTNAHVVQKGMRSAREPLIVERINSDRADGSSTPIEASGFTVLLLDLFYDIALIRVHFKGDTSFMASSPVPISTDPIEDGARVISIATMLTSVHKDLAYTRWLGVDVNDKTRASSGFYNLRFAGVRGGSGSPVFKVTPSGDLALTGLFSGGGNDLAQFGYNLKSLDMEGIFRPETFAMRTQGQFSAVNSFEHLPAFGIPASDLQRGTIAVNQEQLAQHSLAEARKVLAEYNHTNALTSRDAALLLRVRHVLDFGSDADKLANMKMLVDHTNPEFANQVLIALAFDFDSNWIFRNRRALAEILGVDSSLVLTMIQANRAEFDSVSNRLAFGFGLKDNERVLRSMIREEESSTHRSIFLSNVRKQRCEAALRASGG